MRRAAKVDAQPIISVIVPVRIVSESNRRDYYMAAAARKKAHRAAAKRALGADIKGPPPPYVIELTRIAEREMDDDNLAGGFKALRDGVADWLGIDDGDKRLTWVYGQRKGARGQYAAEVAIYARAEP